VKNIYVVAIRSANNRKSNWTKKSL